MELDRLKKPNRLAIYFFQNDDNILDRYVLRVLDDVQANCCELVVVCSNLPSEKVRNTFSDYTSNVLFNGNIQSSMDGYQYAIKQYGWTHIRQFREVVLIDSSVMGPLVPLEEVFASMNAGKPDFWGITKCHSTDKNLSIGYIQPYFLVVGDRLLQSELFAAYWNNSEDSIDAFGFTNTFAQAGFRWDVFVNTDSLENLVNDPLGMVPAQLVQDFHCPFFLKQTFSYDYHYYLNHSDGAQPAALMRYLKEHTDFDVGLIWEHILRTSNMADIKACLNLNYILPADHAPQNLPTGRTALVIHAHFEDMIDYCYNYALSMPEDSELFITVGSERIKRLVENHFLGGPWKKVTVISVENRGRDVSALLIGAAEYIRDFDYVCFMHDKKVSHLDLGIKGRTFSERCFQNLLGSKALVANILSLFEQEPFLGLLFPPVPNHAEYYPLMGDSWGPNYAATEQLSKELNLHCPITADKEPVAPLGTMFWFRPKALAPLLEKNWKYEDFPEEPICTDGTLLHAIERIYPFVVQHSGYFSGCALNDEYAAREWNNLSYMLCDLNSRAMKIYGGGKHSDLMQAMDCWHGVDTANVPTAVLVRMIKQKMKCKVPPFIWKAAKNLYYIIGSGKQRD